jgi:hypothetical protein
MNASDAGLARIRELVYAYPGENLHVADLPYRLCAPSAQDAENVRLFEDGSAQLLAFGIVQAAWGTLDYFIRPAARDHGIEDALMTWAVERFQRLTDARSRDLDWWIDTRADLPTAPRSPRATAAPTPAGTSCTCAARWMSHSRSRAYRTASPVVRSQALLTLPRAPPSSAPRSLAPT